MDLLIRFHLGPTWFVARDPLEEPNPFLRAPTLCRTCYTCLRAQVYDSIAEYMADEPIAADNKDLSSDAEPDAAVRAYQRHVAQSTPIDAITAGTLPVSPNLPRKWLNPGK